MSELGPHAPDVQHPSPHRHRVSLWLIAVSLVLAPAVWSLQTLTSYGIAAQACYPSYAPLAGTQVPGMSGILVAEGLVALAFAIFALGLSIRVWRRTRDEKKGGAGEALETGEGRTRFLALCGAIVSALFCAAIVFEALSATILQHCLNAAV